LRSIARIARVPIRDRELLRVTGMMVLAVAATSCATDPFDRLGTDPEPEAYLARAKGATIVPAGSMEIDGRRVSCGPRPTILDPGLNDHAVSFAKFIVVNPTLMAKAATPVKLWIYNHACGHQSVGPDEAKADCYGVQRGRLEGWLVPEQLQQICVFIESGQPDSVHFAGTSRCDPMRVCYAQPVPSALRQGR
jgi:hypothetical protein